MIAIYHTVTKVGDMIIEGSPIPKGWTDKKPRWQPYEIWTGTEWGIDETAKARGNDLAADEPVKADIVQLEGKQIRPMREIIKKLKSGTAISDNDPDWKKFIEISCAIDEKRSSLKVKG